MCHSPKHKSTVCMQLVRRLNSVKGLRKAHDKEEILRLSSPKGSIRREFANGVASLKSPVGNILGLLKVGLLVFALESSI